jgi:hypothetical protein
MEAQDNVLATVKTALQKRLAVVADRDFYARDPAGHLTALQETSAALDAAVQKLPEDADPRLRHFLERQSYLKALDFLQNATAASPGEV